MALRTKEDGLQKQTEKKYDENYHLPNIKAINK